MPRRKTQQPEPRERFEVDGIEVEVSDGDTWLTGRGLHKQKEWELKANKQEYPSGGIGGAEVWVGFVAKLRKKFFILCDA